MNYKKVLFNYIIEKERYTRFPQLEKIEEKLLESLSDEQKQIFETYINEYSKFYTNRIYYYFCKGIKVKL